MNLLRTLQSCLALSLSAAALDAELVVPEPIGFGYVDLAPTALGSYTYWANWYTNENPGTYEGNSDFKIGVGEVADEYNIFRGYIGFSVPYLTGELTREDVGFPDPAYPELQTIRAQLSWSMLKAPGAMEGWFDDPWYPVEVRLIPMSVQALTALSDEEAFYALAGGTRIVPFGSEFEVSTSPQWFDLGQTGLDFLGEGMVDFVLSFSIQGSRFYTLADYPEDFVLGLTYDLYPPDFSPVPEPSTYGMGGVAALLCIAGARRLRSRRQVAC